jgi:TM2 domain-containing membrane protein YozV
VSAPEPRSIRIGNSERDQAVQALGEHFAQGRLEPYEFEERAAAAYAARTAAELDRLFEDLPYTGAQHPTLAQPGRHGTGAYSLAAPPAGGPGPSPLVGPPGYDPQAPFGREPVTGVPYSDRSKVVAGVLQLLLPCGVGRLYSGHTGIGVAQLLLTLFFGLGALWAFIDGIVILAGRPTDRFGRPLRS